MPAALSVKRDSVSNLGGYVVVDVAWDQEVIFHQKEQEGFDINALYTELMTVTMTNNNAES